MSEPNPLTIGGFVYAPDDRISLMTVEEKNEWNLIIKDVQLRDSGVYECAVISGETYRTHVILNVIGKSILFHLTLIVLFLSFFSTFKAIKEDVIPSHPTRYFIFSQYICINYL